MRRALKRSDVLAYLDEQYQAVRTSARARTIHRAEDLADNAQSEHVRLQANEWLAGIDGVAPLARGEIEHRHTGMAPGLTIIVRGSEQHCPGDELKLIEGQPTKPKWPVNRIGGGPPVPHPSLTTGDGAHVQDGPRYEDQLRRLHRAQRDGGE